MLDVQNISKTFNPGTVNEKKAITELSLHLEGGEFATIVGSNGAGKSTLFNAISGSFSLIPGVSDLTDRISPSCLSINEAWSSAASFRIPCAEPRRI